MIFDADGAPIATHHRADLCGAAARAGGFTVTDGRVRSGPPTTRA